MAMSMTPEDIAWLKQHFGELCEEIVVEGDEPLLLDDPEFAYVTQAPQHQLFCVGYRDGAAAGRREHIALCRPGQLLLGLGPSTGDQPTALLLSGMAGSHVLRLSAKTLFEAIADPRVQRLFDGWIELLASTVPAAPVPTRCRAVTAGESLALSEAAPLRAKQGMVWVELPRTPSRYGGVDLDELQPPSVHWPITETVWALAEGGEVRATGSRELLDASASGAFAQPFYDFIVALLEKRRVSLERARLERDLVSREAEGRFVSDSLQKLAAVGRGELLPPDVGRGDSFQQACRTIAIWLGIEPPHVPSPAGPALSHMQTALSRVTGMRMRPVLLEGAWHKHDAGALLGFVMEDEDELVLHPVALLPTPGGYQLDDPSQDDGRPVTAELAEQLHPQAYQFYCPLPDRPLSPLDVLRFSSRRALRDVTFVLVVGAVLGALGMLIPLLTGHVVDHLIPGAERGLLLQLTLVLVCVYLGQALLDVARGLSLVRAQTRMDATLEAAIWDRLLGLPLPFFRKYSAGDLSSRAAGIGAIREVLAGTTLSALLGGLFSIWNVGLLFWIDSRLAFAATGLAIVAAIPAGLAAHYGLKQERRVADYDGKIGGLLLQLLSGISKLRVSGAENRAFAVWARLFAGRRDADLRAEWVNVRVAVFQSAFPIVSSMVLFWMLAGGGQQTISTGQFLAFSAAFGTFLFAVLHVIESGLESLSVIPMYERAKPILTQPAESHGGGQRVELSGDIEVNHVSFRYHPDGPLVLDDVSLQIGADEFVALVGPSGSGKSTLLRLLLGFETCTEGGVFYDGQALSNLDVRVVRQQVGVVMQNSQVMAGDIYKNIVGSTGLTIDDAWRAARQAALAESIEAMPMGMHTVISQGGGTLSGGQRQRLLIARALAAKPRILFFDEATSALDNVTQAAVSQSLESLRVTRVVIAHRLSTIRQADRIVVLEAGRVVQTGRFDELMAEEGPFRVLAERQML